MLLNFRDFAERWSVRTVVVEEFSPDVDPTGLRFEEYLEEKKAEPFIKGHGTMTDTGTKGKEYHQKYFGHEAAKKHGQKFVLAYDHPQLGKAGSEHSFDDVKEKNGKWYATVKGHEVRVNQFHKPTGGRTGKMGQSAEVRQVEELSKAIENAIKSNKGKPIPMLLNGKKEEVAGIKRVEGESPKADAYTVDLKGKPNHWMSLKDDTFQQWGGVDKRSLGDAANHPAIKDAIKKLNKVKERISSGSDYLPSGTAYHVDMDKDNPEHRRLINLSTYGQDFGKEYGKNNVHAVYGGKTIDVEEHEHPEHGRVWKFKPKAHYENTNDENADTPESKFQLTNRSGSRNIGLNGRIMITPKDFMSQSREHTVTAKKGYEHVPLLSIRKKETEARNAAKKAEKESARAAKKAEADAARAKALEDKEKVRAAKKKASQPSRDRVPPMMKKMTPRLGNDGSFGGADFRGKE
jgi:hypothetical protein